MTIKELREKKAKIAAEVKRLADLANQEDHSWTPEDEQSWTRANEDYDTTDTELGEAESRQEKAARAAALQDSLEDRGIGNNDRVGSDGATLDANDETRMVAMQAWMRHQNGLDLTERHEAACQATGLNPRRSKLDIRLGDTGSQPCWSRDGRPILEDRNLTVGTNADGGFTVPEGFVSELERTLLAFGGPRQVSRVIRTDSGNPLPWPTVDDTSNTGALLAEEGSIGSSVDATFANVTLNAYKYSSKPILISEELLQDSAFNMGQVINSLLGERLGRITAADYTNGDGSSKPKGVVACASAGVAAASQTALTADELIDLVHTVDPAYRSAPGVGFMLNDSTIKAIRKLKDGDGQYLWQPGLRSGTPDAILNHPFTVNQNMASIASGAVSVLFGDFQKFLIRDVRNMRFYRLEERYRDNDLTGFVAFLRTDSDCIQAGAIKKLTQASS